jgi:UDP-glucose 4-epimerase
VAASAAAPAGGTPSRRVLITGLSTYWGGRLAQALEQSPAIEAIIGVDSEDPTRELERTEFVRVGTQHALLRRLVDAASIDTVIDTRLVVDSVTVSPRTAHENNVIGTMNILAACTGPESTVRKFVFKSSAHYYGAEQDDPAFFTESMGRPHAPATAIERDIVEAEASVADFAERSPRVLCTVLRFANVLGPDVRTSHTSLFGLPAVPMILGFDPRYQFAHEDDVVSALEHAVANEVPGTYNVAGDGVLALSEVIDLLGKHPLPLLPPWGTGVAAAALSRLGLRIPPEMLKQLRFGRGLDNRKLKATGFSYRYTTREAVLRLAEHMRLNPIVRGVREPYRYERDVEEFLRWSPSVRREEGPDAGPLSAHQLAELQKLVAVLSEGAGLRGRGPTDEELAKAAPRRTPPAEPPPAPEPEPAAAEPGSPVEHYDDLEAEEIIALLGSLDDPDLATLADYEQSARARPTVLSAIQSVRARRGSPARS